MLLFLFSLFNVHPLGGLIGLSIHSLKINKIKSFYTGFLSAISITSILWQINNDDIQFMSGTIEASYGIQYFINRFTSLNIYLGFSYIFIDNIYIHLQKTVEFQSNFEV